MQDKEEETFDQLVTSLQSVTEDHEPEEEEMQDDEEEKQEQEEMTTIKRQDPIPPAQGEEVRKPNSLSSLREYTPNSPISFRDKNENNHFIEFKHFYRQNPL